MVWLDRTYYKLYGLSKWWKTPLFSTKIGPSRTFLGMTVHIQPVWVFFRTCWFNTSLDCPFPSQHIPNFISFGLCWMCHVQMPLDFQLEKMCSAWWWFLGNLYEPFKCVIGNAVRSLKISIGKRIPWRVQNVVRIGFGTQCNTNGSKVSILIYRLLSHVVFFETLIFLSWLRICLILVRNAPFLKKCCKYQ